MVSSMGVDAMMVMPGNNDLLQHPRLSAEVCTERMERFLTTLLKELPVSCKVLLIAPPPMKAGAWVDDSGTLEESGGWQAAVKPWHRGWASHSRTRELGMWSLHLTAFIFPRQAIELSPMECGVL